MAHSFVSKSLRWIISLALVASASATCKSPLIDVGVEQALTPSRRPTRQSHGIQPEPDAIRINH